MNTFSNQIDAELAECTHPIYSSIRDAGGAATMTHCVRLSNGHFNWCNSRLAADKKTSRKIKWIRIGVNLFSHATGRSLGAVFEFDGPSHKGGLTEEQIAIIKAACERLGYVLAVWSTGGGGIHVFIRWDRPIEATPAEHRILCKRAAIKFCQDAGIPIDWVDATSNVLWIATDDPQPKSFEVISEATERLNPDELPPVPAIPHTKHGDIPDIRPEDQQLIRDLRDAGFYAEWAADIGAIHAHKKGLEAVQHKYPGRFTTASPGSDPSSPNCWIRANEDGGWWVYSWQEREPGWEQSPGGFTRVRFGVAPTFRDANTGTPESRSSFRYEDADEAIDVVRALTGQTLVIPDDLRGDRQYSVVLKGDVVRLHAHKLRNDEPRPEGWHKGRGYWWTAARPDGSVATLEPAAVRNQFWQTSQSKRLTGIYRYKGKGAAVRVSRPEAASIARHLMGGEDPTALIDEVTANEVELVCEAFAPVLQPGALNIGPQFVVEPEAGGCRSWLKMLARLGKSLTPALREPGPVREWAVTNGITSGGRYLLYWCAYLIQCPRQRVPGIAFYGPQGSGKSTLGDALALLMDEGATSDAGEILRKGSQFTGPVACSVIGRIEEIDASDKSKRDRLNSWITAPYLWAEFKGETPFQVPNHLHILMTCNSPRYIPVYTDDTRFTVVEVGKLQGDPQFMEKLRSERAAFLHLCQAIELPESVDRLGLLPVDTYAKEQIAESNQSLPERFATETLTVEGDGFLTNAAIFDEYKKWCQATGTIQSVEDSAALASELAEWYSLQGVAANRTSAGRGRVGLTLAS